MREPKPAKTPSPLGHFREIHGPEALDQVPEARACIADTIAYFSASEAGIRIFLQGCFGEDKDAAAELIDTARSDSFISVLLPVALSCRNRPDMNKATAMFLAARSKVKTWRDVFAHGVFAARSDLPGKILLMKADPYRSELRDFATRMHQPGWLDRDKTVPDFTFQSWELADFLAARSMAAGLLNATHAMQVCLARLPQEVGAWRSALEQRGLLEEPPHSAIYRQG